MFWVSVVFRFSVVFWVAPRLSILLYQYIYIYIIHSFAYSKIYFSRLLYGTNNRVIFIQFLINYLDLTKHWIKNHLTITSFPPKNSLRILNHSKNSVFRLFSINFDFSVLWEECVIVRRFHCAHNQMCRRIV